MNAEQTYQNVVADLDEIVFPRTLPSFDGPPWEVSVGVSTIAVTKAQPTKPIDPNVTDRADYYLWCGTNICIHQPPEQYRGHVTNYFVSITPNVQGAFRHPPVKAPADRWLELVRWSPETTSGSTSYTSGMSTSINGSIGFMGDLPMASVGGGVTWNNSQTRSTPDVDIAAYTRSNSAQFMFNVNQPSTIAATSSMEIYVQALFRLEGFSPEYLAYLDYSQGKPIDATSGLPPLTAENLSNWNKPATNQPTQRESMLNIRSVEYTDAIRLSFQIDFQAITDRNILPMSPVTVPCATPLVNIMNDAWQAFLAHPAATTLPVSDAVGDNSTTIGYLITGDTNYLPTENPNVLSQTQTLRSWNGEYALNLKDGIINIFYISAPSQNLWHGQNVTVAPPTVHLPVSVESTLSNAKISSLTSPLNVNAALVAPAPAPIVKPAAVPPATPMKPTQLEFNGDSWQISGGSLPAPRHVVCHMVGQPDAHPYRRLELTGTGILRIVDSSGNLLWASSYPPVSSTPGSSSGIFSSIGGLVNGLEAIGSGALQLASSVLGVGSLLPGLVGGIASSASGAVGSAVGTVTGGVQTGVNGLVGTFRPLVVGAPGVVQSAGSTIVGGLQTAGSTVGGGLQTAGSTIGGGVEGAAGAIAGVFSSI
jgi:hypothetical protein